MDYIDVCNLFIKGRITLIEVARELRDERDNYVIQGYDAILLFNKIANETDALPVSESERLFWNNEALKLKDLEIQKVNEKYYDKAINACKLLIIKNSGAGK